MAVVVPGVHPLQSVFCGCVLIVAGVSNFLSSLWSGSESCKRMAQRDIPKYAPKSTSSQDYYPISLRGHSTSPSPFTSAVEISHFPFRFGLTGAPESRKVDGSTLVASNVGVLKIATVMFPFDFVLMTSGNSSGLISMPTVSAFGSSATIVEKWLTPVKVAARPPASTIPAMGLPEVSRAGTNVPVIGSTLNKLIVVPGITYVRSGKITVIPGAGSGKLG
jgi:hypothetical protein